MHFDFGMNVDPVEITLVDLPTYYWGKVRLVMMFLIFVTAFVLSIGGRFASKPILDSFDVPDWYYYVGWSATIVSFVSMMFWLKEPTQSKKLQLEATEIKLLNRGELQTTYQIAQMERPTILFTTDINLTDSKIFSFFYRDEEIKLVIQTNQQETEALMSWITTNFNQLENLKI